MCSFVSLKQLFQTRTKIFNVGSKVADKNVYQNFHMPNKVHY